MGKNQHLTAAAVPTGIDILSSSDGSDNAESTINAPLPQTVYAAVCDVTDDVTKNGGINDDVQCTDNADVSSGVICADNDSTLPAVNVGSLQFNDQVNTNNADWELVKRQHPKKKIVNKLLSEPI